MVENSYYLDDTTKDRICFRVDSSVAVSLKLEP